MTIEQFQWTDESRKRLEILDQFEPVQMDVLFNYMQAIQAEIFIDVGANIGAYSVCATSLQSHRRGFLFEAARESFAECEKNIALNGLQDRINCFDCAISDREGVVQFGVSNSLSGINAIANSSIHNPARYAELRKVRSKPLDAVLQLKNEKIGIKIDVEGHEQRVIQGAQKLLENNTCVIQAEIGYADYKSTIDLLENQGYKKIVSIGPDYYFSNDDTLCQASAFLPVIERKLKQLIDYHVQHPPSLLTELENAQNKINYLRGKLKDQNDQSPPSPKVEKSMSRISKWFKNQK